MKRKMLFGLLLMVMILFGNQLLSVDVAQAALPPRHQHRAAQVDKPVGAYLQLNSSPAGAGSWAVVQWQDSAGGWHDVKGWRGDIHSSQHWWVAARDFGKGPFRWAVTDGPDGRVLGASQSFQLPDTANQTLMVTVSSSGG